MGEAPWWRGPMLAWDTESTGVDVETDRIVTAALVWIDPGKPVTSKHHLVDPGVEIPAAATAIHGITTDRVQAEGRQPEAVLEEVAVGLVNALAAGVPLVGMNVCYDFTLLDRELRRHGLRTLADRTGGDPISPVVDALVLDRYVAPRRRGSRRLTALCEVWGVPMDGAHDANFDALGAARVAWKIAYKNSPIGRMSLGDLHALQIRERARQQAELRAYFDRIGRQHDGMPGDWPMLPYTRQEVLT